MYENLIEALRFCAKNGDCHDCPYEKPCAGTMGDGLYCEAAYAIEELQAGEKKFLRNISALEMENENLKRAMRWIPVTERLPEAGERVMCYCRANIYEAMKMRTDGDWVCDTNHVYMHSFVTHWMPLPQPPKEET